VICLNMTDNIVPDFFPSQPEALTLQIESITCGIALGLVSSLITGVSLNFCLRPSHPREPEGDEFISRP
jgi:hypothetical protein